MLNNLLIEVFIFALYDKNIKYFLVKFFVYLEILYTIYLPVKQSIWCWILDSFFLSKYCLWTEKKMLGVCVLSSINN